MSWADRVLGAFFGDSLENEKAEYLPVTDNAAKEKAGKGRVVQVVPHIKTKDGRKWDLDSLSSSDSEYDSDADDLELCFCCTARQPPVITEDSDDQTLTPQASKVVTEERIMGSACCKMDRMAFCKIIKVLVLLALLCGLGGVLASDSSLVPSAKFDALKQWLENYASYSDQEEYRAQPESLLSEIRARVEIVIRENAELKAKVAALRKMDPEERNNCRCGKLRQPQSDAHFPWLEPTKQDGIFKQSDIDSFKVVPLESWTKVFSGKRKTTTPYIVEFPSCHGHPCSDFFVRAAKTRDDVIWVKHDLGNHILHYDGSILDGITTPPEKFWKGKIWDPTEPATHDLVFQGRCSTGGSYGGPELRKDLHYLIKDSKHPLPERFSLNCVKKTEKKAEYNLEAFRDLVGSSDFSLVPHGDMRWSFRFIESIGACSIPVVIADGLTLPYEQLVDWGPLVIRISEQAFNNMTDVRDFYKLIPFHDKEWIRQTRLKICNVNDKFFRNGAAREDGFWSAARAFVRAHQAFPLGAANFLTNRNCQDPLRMCHEEKYWEPLVKPQAVLTKARDIAAGR